MIWQDRNETTLGTLTLIKSRMTDQTDNLDQVELTCLEPVEKLHRLLYRDNDNRWREYIVQSAEQIHSVDGIAYEVEALNSLVETQGDWVNDNRPNNTTAQLALSSIIGNTRWAIDSVTVAGLNSAMFYRISFFEALQILIKTWGGEIVTSITFDGTKVTRRGISVIPAKGTNRGKRFVYGKDIIDVRRTILDAPIITALKGYGKGEEIGDGYGRRVDFASINNGKDYVENLTALNLYGRNAPGGTKVHVFAKVEFDEITDKTELKRLTEIELAKISVPQVTYEASVIDLSKYGYVHEGTSIGDTVAVIDDDIGLTLLARVMKIERDIAGDEADRIQLGNFRPTIASYNAEVNRVLGEMRTSSGVWDRANIISPDGTLAASQVTNLINEWNRIMNVGLMAGETTAYPGGYLFENDTEGWAMEISTLGFRIANSKNPDNTWNWTTLGTGDGLAANTVGAPQLIAGSITTDHVSAVGIDATKIMVGGTTLDQQLITITERLGEGGENLLQNPTFGGLQAPSTNMWASNYIMKLLLGRFVDKTMGDFMNTMANKTMGDLINNAY